MNKIHVTVVALILGASGALGVAAATHTAALRTPAAGGVSDSAIAARTKQLDKVERQIARAGRDKPPALPAVPASRTLDASRHHRMSSTGGRRPSSW